MPDRYRKQNDFNNYNRSTNPDYVRTGRQPVYSERSGVRANQAAERRLMMERKQAAERRRRIRRRRAVRRVFTFIAVVLIFTTIAGFIWSQKHNVKDSFSSVMNLFSSNDKKTEKDKDSANDNQSEKINENDNKQGNSNAPEVSEYASDGMDFVLNSQIKPFMNNQRAIVLIDPGHGGIDGGAPGRLSDGTSVKEADVVMKIALKLQADLTERNIESYLIREDDTFHSLYARVARASLLSLDYMNAYQIDVVSDRDFVEGIIDKLQVPIEINSDNPDSGGFGFMRGYGMSQEQMRLLDLQKDCKNVIFVSLHCNAHDYDTSLHGMQAYYCHDSNVEESEAQGLLEQTEPSGNGVYWNRDNERNRKLAQFVYDGAVTKAPQISGTNAGDPVLQGNYAVLREHGLAGTLLELAYMSNKNDLQLLMDDSFQKNLAQGIGNGIEKYFTEIFS